MVGEGEEIEQQVKLINCKDFPPMLATINITPMYNALGITSILIDVLVILLNCLVLYAFVATKRFKTPADVLLLWLISTDLILGVFTLPLYANSMFQIGRGWVDCQLATMAKTVSFSLVVMSLINIGLISIQVYLSISRPFFYLSTANKRAYQSVLTISWVIIILTTTIVFNVVPQYAGYFKIALGTVCCLICAGVCFTHVKMNAIIREISKKSSVYGGRIIKLKKSIRISLAIIFAFIASYLPAVVVFVAMACIKNTLWTRSYVAPWTELTIMGNSLLNPLIYCLRLKVVRVKIGKLLCGRLCFKQRVHQHRVVSRRTVDPPVALRDLQEKQK